MRRSARDVTRIILLMSMIALYASVGKSQSEENTSRASRRIAKESNTGAPQRAAEVMNQLGVRLEQGKLTIIADNTVLSEVLRQVAGASGLMITGTIPDEPVFGTYGPDGISAVLCALLQGTDTNILFSGSSRLILTPRHGLRTLSSRKTISYGGTVIARPEVRGGSSTHPPAELPERAKESKAQPIGPSGVPGDGPGPSLPPGGPIWTNERSPNGIKTPCEIRKQLTELGQPLEGALSTPRGSLDPCR